MKKQEAQILIVVILLIIVGSLLGGFLLYNPVEEQQSNDLKLDNNLKNIYGIYIQLPIENMTGGEKRWYLINELTKIKKGNPFPLYVSLQDSTGELLDKNDIYEKYYLTPADIPEQDDCIKPNVCFIKYGEGK